MNTREDAILSAQTCANRTGDTTVIFQTWSGCWAWSMKHFVFHADGTLQTWAEANGSEFEEITPELDYPECDTPECTMSAHWVHEGDFLCSYHVDTHPYRNHYQEIETGHLYVDVVGTGEEQLDYPYAND